MIDVSGDGPNNEGHMVERARDDALSKGIIINGLPIMTPADQFDIYYLPDLDKYYAGCVIGGPGSFIQIAHGFEDLARALRRKLIQEISDAATPSRLHQSGGGPATLSPFRLRKRLRYRRKYALWPVAQRPEREADLQFLPR